MTKKLKWNLILMSLLYLALGPSFPYTKKY